VPYFEAQTQAAIQKAAAQIPGQGWQDKFSAAQSADAQTDLSRVKEHATASEQRMMDVQLVDAYHRMLGAGNPAAAKFIVQGINDPTMRATLLASHPEAVVNHIVTKAITSGSDEDLLRIQNEARQNQVRVDGVPTPIPDDKSRTQVNEIRMELHRRATLAKAAKEEEWKAKALAFDKPFQQYLDISMKTGTPFARVEELNRMPGEPPIAPDPTLPDDEYKKRADRLKEAREGGFTVTDPQYLASWANLTPEQWARVGPASVAAAKSKLDISNFNTLMGWYKAAQDGHAVDSAAKEFRDPEFVSNTLMAYNEMMGTSFKPEDPFDKQPAAAREAIDRVTRSANDWRGKHPDKLKDPLGLPAVRGIVASLKDIEGTGTVEQVIRSQGPAWYVPGTDARARGLSQSLPLDLSLHGLDQQDSTLREHSKLIFGTEAPLVDAAWARYQGGGDAPPRALVQVHSILTPYVGPDGQQYDNPELKMVDAELDKRGLKPTTANRIAQIVLDYPEQKDGAHRRGLEQDEADRKIEARNAEIARRKAEEQAAADALEKTRRDYREAVQKLPSIPRNVENILANEYADFSPPGVAGSPEFQAELAAAVEADHKTRDEYRATHGPSDRVVWEDAQRAVRERWMPKDEETRAAQWATFRGDQARLSEDYFKYLRDNKVPMDVPYFHMLPTGVLDFSTWRAQRQAAESAASYQEYRNSLPDGAPSLEYADWQKVRSRRGDRHGSNDPATWEERNK